MAEAMAQQWTCTRCGDVIGVYEATILVEDEPRTIARLGRVEQPDGDLYHVECWTAIDGEAA